MENNFKLIILGTDWDVYEISYQELIENPHVTYITTFRPAGLLGQLQRIQFNPKLNHIISIPGKSWWNPYYLRNIQEKKLCILIMEKWLRHESGLRLLPYLKKHYPEARIVCFFQDLIGTLIDRYTNQQIDVNYIKRYADLLISYDEVDAKKYRISYHPTIFSPIIMPALEVCYDLYFLGRDKGRMNTLITISQEAKKRGLKCLFIMMEVPQKERVNIEGFVFADKPVPYMENLQYAAKSRCIIELLQQDAQSATYRTWEAIMLNKKLLTQNQQIKTCNIYDDRYISIFNTPDEINWNFISEESQFPNLENPYQKQISPYKLVEFIENKLNIKIDR